MTECQCQYRAPYEATLLNLFDLRCRELAGRVRAGRLSIVDAVDMAYEAAIWSGLADGVGDDVVQHVLACAFMGLPR
jgi:hypothetical protein